jgi:GH15 family glucan-1,4-alpha-glucosidase
MRLQARRTDGFLRIEDYGAVGNLSSVALVGTDGSVDWCCFPYLSSPSVFGALLDPERGGHFRVGLRGGHPVEQFYLEDTNVLCTRWRSEHGALRVLDFMPVEGRLDGSSPARGEPELWRLLVCEGGEVEVLLEWAPRLDHGRGQTAVERVPDGFLAHQGPSQLTLSGAPAGARVVPLGHGAGVQGVLRLRAGDRHPLVTRWGGFAEGSHRARAEERLEATTSAWRGWLHKAEARGERAWAGPWRGLVKRSELALKLLTFNETGAIAAAATTSLPETLGGVRNWDYRYAWIRDAGLTAQALTALGHRAEAGRFLHWAERASEVREEAAGRLQIMYGLHGEAELPEEELHHLRGYQDSRPVRVGNEAAEQRQHDIYGELLTSGYELARAGERLSPEITRFLAWTADETCRTWSRRDSGIWEVRGQERHYTYSKILSWAALDRALRLRAMGVLPEGREPWAWMREEIRRTVLEHAWNGRVRAFVQSFDSEDLDASNLLIPLQELLPADDPRVQATIDRTLEALTENGLVYRYRMDDGLPGEEGAFVLTTFWLVDALALSGRRQEAWDLFEGVARRASHLGLFAEQMDPRTGAFLGNFPQAFSHLGLINSTLYLAYMEGRPLPVPPLLGTPEHRRSPVPSMDAPGSGAV